MSFEIVFPDKRFFISSSEAAIRSVGVTSKAMAARPMSFLMFGIAISNKASTVLLLRLSVKDFLKHGGFCVRMVGATQWFKDLDVCRALALI